MTVSITPPALVRQLMPDVEVKVETTLHLPLPVLKRLQQQNGWSEGLEKAAEQLLDPLRREIVARLADALHQDILRGNEVYSTK